MTNKEIRVGVIPEDELLLFYDYLNSELDGNQYALIVTNHRGKEYTTRMIDEDGENWYMLKLLFGNKYQRVKKDSVRSFEIKKISS